MMMRLLTFRPLLFLAALATWTACSCVPILTGLAGRAVFNRLQGGHEHGLWLLLGGLAALAIVEPALTVCWYWTHMTFETTLEALVRTNFYAAGIDSSDRSLAPVAMLGRLRDDVPEYTGLVNEWYRLAGEAVFVAIALVIMLRIEVTITLLAFLPLAVIVLLTHWMRSRLPRLWGQAREATITATTFIGEIFSGVQAIKVAGAESAAIDRFARLNDARAGAETRALAAQVRIDAITDATTTVGQAIVLLVGATEMLAGRFSVGDFVLFGSYLEWMLMLPRRAGRLLSQRRTSRRSLGRLTEAVDPSPAVSLVAHRPIFQTPAAGSDTHAVEPLRELTVTGLTYRHPRTRRGITDIDLHIRAGTLTVVTGPVGAGKSTLLEVLLGLRRADSGRFIWNGIEVDDPATFMRPPRVAYKPQLPRLFNESLVDNILLGIERDEVALAAAVQRAGLDEDVARLPEHVDTHVGSRGVRLSGGQAQRAATARVHVRAPQIYVIDDLTSGLDHHTQQQIWPHLLASIRDGATWLLVSHQPAALDHADQIITLDNGRREPIHDTDH